MIDDVRFDLLCAHYRNQSLYIARLRQVLKNIQTTAIEEGDILLADLVEVTLDPEKAPPSPFTHFYDEGAHSGHPYHEYLAEHLGPLTSTNQYYCPTCKGVCKGPKV